MSDRATSTARAPQRTSGRSTPSRTDLRIVQTGKARARSRQLACSLALVVMFSALLASAVFHSVLVAGQQRLDRLDTRVEQRQQLLSRARLRVAELSSPGRVVATAKRRGMVLPDHTTWLAATPPASAPAAPAAGQARPSGSTGNELAGGRGGPAPAGRTARPGRTR